MVKLEIDYHSALSLADTLCRDNPNDARVKELRDWIADAGEIVKAGAEASEQLESVKAERDETAEELREADEKADDQEKEIDRLHNEISDKNTEIWNLQEEIKELRQSLVGVLDGALGYICEHGTGKRYWKAGVIGRAEALLKSK